jgi:nicotinate-nucleotide adenylyltransferase
VKLAVLGGSFNPLHLAHLHLADLALTAFGFDRILLVPANISPFKRVSDTSAADRLDMILASIAADPRLGVDDLELRRGGVSYTIDTLKEIIRRYKPEGKPALILGDDLAADFPKWKGAEKIPQIADIIVARRMTGKEEPVFPYPHRTLNNEVMDLSSAMIRERIAQGRAQGSDRGSDQGSAWHYLVPREVRYIIEDRGLYLSKKAAVKRKAEETVSCEIIARVEDAVRGILPVKRFIHSRNTALVARDLALRCGLDGNAAYLAGIAHDMAKNQTPGLLHGKAAAVLLQERFGIHNKDILEAVEFHTTGKPGMGDLAKAVFIADKIEFSRPCTQDRFREMAAGKSGLDELFYAVLKDNVDWLKKTGIDAAEDTLKLLKE